MTPNLLNFLCELINQASLRLINEFAIADGTNQSCALVSPSGACYPIINGIPRFVSYVPSASMDSFGDEWNFLALPALRSIGLSTLWPTPLSVQTRSRVN